MSPYKSVERLAYLPGKTKLLRQPYVLENGMKDWGALGKYSPQYLKETMGEYRVKMTIGNPEQRTTKLTKTTIATFVDQYALNPSYATLNPLTEVPYLQELNLLKALPGLNDDLQFSSLFPQWCLTRQFAWMGVAGSVTGLHNDSLHNFHAQLYGRKRFLLLPTHKLPKSLINPKYDSGTNLSYLDLLSNDYRSNPHFDVLEAELYEVVLQPGEVLFIPKWWWHQVVSLDTTLSVNCFMTFLADAIPTVFHVLLEILHRLRLYKYGNCACHSPTKSRSD